MARNLRNTLVLEQEEEDDLESPFEHKLEKASKNLKIFMLIKFIVLFSYWLIFTGLMMFNKEFEKEKQFISIPINESKFLKLDPLPPSEEVEFTLEAPFALKKDMHFYTSNDKTIQVHMKLAYVSFNEQGLPKDVVSCSEVTQLEFVCQQKITHVEYTERHLSYTKFENVTASDDAELSIEISSDASIPIGISISYDNKPLPTTLSIVLGFLIIINLYLLLCTDLVNRLLAIFITSSLSIGILACLHSRPGLPTILNVVNVEVLLEIFGITIIAKKFFQTGILDYLAVHLYKICNGHIWPMLNWLCLVAFCTSVTVSSILMMLFVTPILLRICEIMQLNPAPVIACVIISANIGSALTSTLDEVNHIIMRSHAVHDQDVHFFKYLLHMIPGVILASLQSYCHMRIQYYDSHAMRYKEDGDVERLRRVIRVWKRTAKSMHVYTKKEKDVRDTVLSQVQQFKQRFGRLGKMPAPASNFEATLAELKSEYPIHDRPLLIQCCIVLGFVTIFYLIANYTNWSYLTNGWIALTGAVLIILLSEPLHIEGLVTHIEWSTILFIICMYITSHNINQMGLPLVVAPWCIDILSNIPNQYKLVVAILIVLWTSGLSSAFVGKMSVAPVAMVTIELIYHSDEVDVPLMPLIWAAALGLCFGGNGTLISNFSNLLCVTLAENRGYFLSFCDYFRIGFPLLIGNLVVCSIYLMIAHCAFDWH